MSSISDVCHIERSLLFFLRGEQVYSDYHKATTTKTQTGTKLIIVTQRHRRVQFDYKGVVRVVT